MNNIQDFIQEIAQMSRQELLDAKNELAADKEIPKKERSALNKAIDERLFFLKNGSLIAVDSSVAHFFVSFESDGEKLSVVTHKTLGQFVLEVEPEIVYVHAKISGSEFFKLIEKGYGEI